MRIIAAPCLFAIALFAAAPLAAEDYSVGSLHIERPWTRAMPEGRDMGGGYMTIHNAGAEEDRLIAGSSPRAGRVEIHETTIVDDVMRMRPLTDGLPIPAGESVELKPGGLHVMFLEVEQPFAEGERIPAVLEFERGGQAEVEFVVEGLGGQTHGGHGGHRPMHGNESE